MLTTAHNFEAKTFVFHSIGIFFQRYLLESLSQIRVEHVVYG